MVHERRLNGVSVDENKRAISATDLRPDLLSPSTVQLNGRIVTIWSGLGGKVGGTKDATALFRLGTMGGAIPAEALDDGDTGAIDGWTAPEVVLVKFSPEEGIVTQLRVTTGEPEWFSSLIDKLQELASNSDSPGEQIDSLAAVS